MRILVTGGAGFIGSHVAEAYREAGHHVAAVDALLGAAPDRTPAGVRLYRVDIRRPELADVFREERPEVVAHLAAQANVRQSLADPLSDAETNVLGTLRVLELSARHGVTQVIFSSTAGALYGEPQTLPVREDHPVLPTSPYGLHKFLGEQYMLYYRRVHGLNTVILRYGNVYGPRQAPETEAGVVAIFTEAFLSGRRPVIFGDGTQVRDFVFVGDVADANLRALGRVIPDPVHIGTGVGTSVNELAAQLRALTDAPVSPEHGPAVPGEVYRIYLDVARAERVLGWRPRVALEEGLRRTVEWFTARGSRGGAAPAGAGGAQEELWGMIDKELLEILACPACKAPVVQQGDRIVCTGCGRRYPIRDGIPVMLIDEAEEGSPAGG
jgi:UDP-glucose 4-epimerase